MKPSPFTEPDNQDREIIQLLEALGKIKASYPPELLSATRAAFLAQVEALQTADLDEGLSAEDQEVVRLLGHLKAATTEYPADLYAARRAALLRSAAQVEATSVWDQFLLSLQRLFQTKTTTLPVLRMSLVIGSLLAAVFIGSLVYGRTGGSFQPAAAPTQALPTMTRESGITICTPVACPPGELEPGQNLADPENGLARPAVSNDAQANPNGVNKAAYLNDGRAGESWVSNSPDSWIKIDLGQATTINTVSLQRARLGASGDHDPGHFVIAVAMTDVYADGDSSNDYVEYAQVFHSEQTDLSGKVSQAENIRTQFPPVEARFVKVTFEKAGTAIEEVGVFLVRPPVLAEQTTTTLGDDVATTTSTLTQTLTPFPASTGTYVLAGTRTPTTPVDSTPTTTSPPPDTPSALPTNTLPPVDTGTPVPTQPVASDTPIPSATTAPPTAIPPTMVAPTIPAPTESSGTIVVTGNNQNVTFTCNGNAAEIRGHANTVTLLGSCSSITVTGNGNRVFWEFGSPVIINRGKDNIIQQL